MPDDDLVEGVGGPAAGAPVPKKGKRRKRRLLLLLGLPLALLVLFVASVEFTSSSNFCASCHYMKPFFESWKASSHKDVACKVCHYPPGMKSFFRTKIEGLVMVGRYWTRLYVKSKPWAEIQDESCLRPGCHDRRLLEGKVAFGKVVFDHKAHFEDLKRGKKLRCTSCHSQIVQGEHITVTSSTCFICHFKGKTPETRAAECAVCHRKDEVLASKERFDHTGVYAQGYRCDKCHTRTVIGEGEVPKENCDKCHFERDRLAKYGDTDLIHRTHITANKIECCLCHREIEHRIVKDIETIADCRTCHQGTHDAQKILYTGTGGKGVPHASPNIMWEKGLSCQGCHIFHEKALPLAGSTLTAGAAACESCHGRGFARILENWQAATRTRLAEIRAIAARADAEIRRAPGPAKEKAAALLEDARFDIDVVEKGKSVHNMTYSQELLGAALEQDARGVGRGGVPLQARGEEPPADAPDAERLPDLPCGHRRDLRVGLRPAVLPQGPRRRSVPRLREVPLERRPPRRADRDEGVLRPLPPRAAEKRLRAVPSLPEDRLRRRDDRGCPGRPRTSWPRPAPSAPTAISTRRKRSSGRTAGPASPVTTRATGPSSASGGTGSAAGPTGSGRPCTRSTRGP